MIAFQIGQKDADFLCVTILRDNGDDWLAAEVELVTGGFRGKFAADFNSWSFSDFLAGLEKVYRDLAGVATFTSYERQLELELTCDEMGHIKATGEAMDYAGWGNKLRFALSTDQTFVPAILKDLRQVVERYPRRAV